MWSWKARHGSSKRFKGIEEINEKKATYAEIIHKDEVDKDNCNWDNLWGIANTLLSDIVEENENAAKECNDVDVDAKAVLQSFDVFYDRAVILFLVGNSHTLIGLNNGWTQSCHQIVLKIYMQDREGFIMLCFVHRNIEVHCWLKFPCF